MFVAAEMLPGSMNGIGYLITHSRELARMVGYYRNYMYRRCYAAFDSIFICYENKFSGERCKARCICTHKIITLENISKTLLLEVRTITEGFR